MRICFLNLPIEHYSPVSGGAISTIIMETAGELIRAGHEVTVITPDDGGSVYDVGAVIRIGTTRPPNFWRRRLEAARSRMRGWDWPFYGPYLRAVRDALGRLPRPPEAIVMFNDLVSPVHIRRCVPAARLVVWLQNEQLTRSRKVAAAIATTDHFLACSGYIRDWTMAVHGVPPDRISVAGSGVNTTTFRPRPGFDGVPDGPLRVLYVGRLDRNKGPDIAADAVLELRREGRPVSLTIAGGRWWFGPAEDPDPYVRLLRAKAALVEASLLGHVDRAGLPAVYREHDVVCVLSRSNEPFGLVVLEAMASGCAVVASDRGGLPEACGGAALLVPPSVAAVTAALRELVREPETLARLKRMALDRSASAPWSRTASTVLATVDPRSDP